MDTKHAELQLAVAHVQELEERISEQRARIKRLKQLGAPTIVAENLLAILQESLEHLEQHLIFVTEFIRTEEKSTVGHANQN